MTIDDKLLGAVRSGHCTDDASGERRAALDGYVQMVRRFVFGRRERSQLLPFTEVRRGLGLVGQHYIGTRAVGIDRIVGSLDRWRDFDRKFRPLHAGHEHRLEKLRHAFPNNDFPPIVVYEIDGAYFVADGHHRVALAYQRGMLDVDAEVTRMYVRCTPSPDGMRGPSTCR